MKVLENLSEAEALVGQELGLSKWQKITQRQIWKFGMVTGDRQWIHMNPIRAKLYSPFKTTIAHGFLSLSLVPHLTSQAVLAPENLKHVFNYGLDKEYLVGTKAINDFDVRSSSGVGGMGTSSPLSKGAFMSMIGLEPHPPVNRKSANPSPIIKYFRLKMLNSLNIKITS